MPSVLTWATVLLASAGASGTLAVVGAYVLAGAISVGFSIGANALIGALFGPGRPAPSDGQSISDDPVGSHRRNYGIVHTGGQRTFRESRNGTIGQVITLGLGRENDVIEHRINDKPVTLDAGGFVTEASFHGAVSIHTRSGAADQMAIAELTAFFPEWTAAHRQRGCPHAAIIGRAVEAEQFSEVYNGREPAYTQVREGVGLYDPRLDDTMVIGTDEAGEPVYGSGSVRLDDPLTWPWNDNWALVTADYFAHPDGFGGGYADVNWANIAAEADICDQTVSTASAETIARWRIWASYKLANEKRADILEAMRLAADGFFWQDAEGKFNVMCGRWVEPDLVITDDHILSLTAAQGPEAYQVTRAVKVLYTEAATGYREQESATFGSLEADDDGEAQAIQAYYAPHHNQAARIGKLALAELNPDRWRFNALLNLLGIDCLGRRFARFESAKLGLSMWVKIGAPKLDLINLRIETTLTQVEPGDWSFDAALEEGTPPVADTGTGSTPTISDVEGLTLSTIAVQFGETIGVAIEATWTAVERIGLLYDATYRESGGSTWYPMSIDPDASPPSARTGPVSSGVEYEVRVRARTFTGRSGNWSPVATITPIAGVFLGAPTSLAASGGSGLADISFSMPTSSALDYARLFGSDTSDFGDAVQVGSDITGAPGTQVTRQETGLSAGTRYYWAQAFDSDDNGSGVTGPVAATIT